MVVGVSLRGIYFHCYNAFLNEVEAPHVLATCALIKSEPEPEHILKYSVVAFRVKG